MGFFGNFLLTLYIPKINIRILHTDLFIFTLFSCGNDEENLFDNRGLLKLMIISIILMTFTFDSRVIM